MSTQLFLMPTASATIFGQPATVPKYAIPGSGLPLDGENYAATYFGEEGVAIVAADPNAALSAEADVLTMPANLDQNVSSADVTSRIPFLEALNIPANGILGTSLTYRQVLKTIGGVFQFAQKIGQKIFSTAITLDSAFSSLATGLQNSVVNTAQALDLPVPALASAVGSVGSMSLAITPTVPLNPTQPLPPAPIEPSTLDGNSTIRNVLIAAGQQWEAPLILNRGDGFQI